MNGGPGPGPAGDEVSAGEGPEAGPAAGPAGGGRASAQVPNAGPGATTSGGAARGSARGPWVLFTAGLLGLCLAWALAGPRFSVPDEPAHFLKAASVVRGQLHGVAGEGTTSGDGEVGRAVEVPAAFRTAEVFPQCFAFRGDRTADCAPTDFQGGDELVRVPTPAGSYPPLYYALVGWPTLVWEDANVLYAMRAVSAVANVALLVAGTWALSLVVGRRLAMAGALVAATPMVAYLAGSVNPNGLEISAAFATWGFALAARDRLGRGVGVGVPVAAGLAASGAVLASIRWLGPLFLAGILVVAALAGPLRDLRGAWRDRALLAAGGAVLAAVAVAGLVILTTPNTELLPGPPVPEGGVLTKLAALLGQTQYYVRNMIGWFGWLDAPTPTWTYWTWVALVGLLVGAVALVGSRPALRSTALAVVGTLFLPVVAQWPSLDEIGMPWQGRYTLPVGVGVVLLAVVGVAEAGRAGRVDLRRLVPLLAVPAAVGHLVAFYWALRRYATGGHGPIEIVGDAVWNPPGGVLLWLVAATASLVACALAAGVRPGPLDVPSDRAGVGSGDSRP